MKMNKKDIINILARVIGMFGLIFVVCTLMHGMHESEDGPECDLGIGPGNGLIENVNDKVEFDENGFDENGFAKSGYNNHFSKTENTKYNSNDKNVIGTLLYIFLVFIIGIDFLLIFYFI